MELAVTGSKVHPLEDESGQIEKEMPAEKKRQIKSRNKWFLYKTLINNVELIRHRKKEFSYNRLVEVNFSGEKSVSQKKNNSVEVFQDLEEKQND